MSKWTIIWCIAAVGCVSAEPRVAVETGVPAPAMTNPLLSEWTGPYGGVPPWDKVRPELFPEAFQQGIDARRAEITAIANNQAAPTFQNTFVPMQNAGRALNRVGTLFGVMIANTNSPAYQALDREWSPKLSAASDEIVFNAPLFKRIETIYNARTSAGLTAEQQRLVERVYQQFVRSGAPI